MDESLQELENELKRLTPKRPSAHLLQALERELDGTAPGPVARPSPRYTAATTWRSWKWAGWSLAGVAAAAALLVGVQVGRQIAGETPGQPLAPSPAVAAAVTPPAANRYEPVHASTVLYDMSEDAAATVANDTGTDRQVRYRYVDTYTWRNPSTNASLRWSVPRDEVRVIRASLD